MGTEKTNSFVGNVVYTINIYSNNNPVGLIDGMELSLLNHLASLTPEKIENQIFKQWFHRLLVCFFYLKLNFQSNKAIYIRLN